MANDNANPGVETEQPGIYPGKTGPEIPEIPKKTPEMPTRRGSPEREMPNLPNHPMPDEPRAPPNVPESPPPHEVPQPDAPPVLH